MTPTRCFSPWLRARDHPTSSWSTTIRSSFPTGFIFLTPDDHYYRGPLYPLALLPLTASLLLNLAVTMRSRKQLSRKLFLGFPVAIVPMTLAFTVQLFVDVFPLLDIGCVLSTLSVYSLILSDQIEQDGRRQQEIARQRAAMVVLV